LEEVIGRDAIDSQVIDHAALVVAERGVQDLTVPDPGDIVHTDLLQERLRIASLYVDHPLMIDVIEASSDSGRNMLGFSRREAVWRVVPDAINKLSVQLKVLLMIRRSPARHAHPCCAARLRGSRPAN